MDLRKPRLLYPPEQVAFIEVQHRISVGRLQVIIEVTHFVRNLLHRRHVIPDEQVRWLREGEAVDWLEDREPTARFEHTIEFAKRLALGGNKDQDGASRDHIDGCVHEGREIVGGGQEELTAVLRAEL